MLEEEETNNFGPWMLVQRRKRQNNNIADRRKAVPHPAKADGVDANIGKEKLVKEGSLSRSGLSKNQGRSSALSNGKKIQVEEPNKSASRVLTSSEPIGPNSHLEAQTSLQSQAHAQSLEPVSNPNLSSFPQLPPTLATPKQHEAALISLQPQIPTRHDKHQMGFDSNAFGSYEMGNRFERSNNPHHRRHNRDYHEGPSSRIGLVRDRDSASLDRNLTSDSSTRLSRSPSPNRYGLAPGNQSILEFSSRHFENRQGALSSEN